MELTIALHAAMPPTTSSITLSLPKLFVVAEIVLVVAGGVACGCRNWFCPVTLGWPGVKPLMEGATTIS